jgi:YHS domain-containing protein
MKKDITCPQCNSVSSTEILCDTCGKNLVAEFHGVPITTEFSYGHPLDGSEYNFCNYRCLLRFIVAELNKMQDANKSNYKEKTNDKG